jgi:hypothetical protein
MSTITEDEKTRISFAPTVSKNTVCNEVHEHHVKKSPEKIPSQDVNVYYPKGCCAQGFCLLGPRVHKAEECKPSNCMSCQNINLQLRLREEIPTCHDARTCPCVPYKKPDERTKITKKIAYNLYQCYVSSGKLSNQIEIENLNRENNIWPVSKTLPKPVNITKVDVNDLFKLKSNPISYASVLLSKNGESSVDESSKDKTSEVVTSEVVTSEVVSSVDVTSEVVSSVDESSKDESSKVVSSKVVSSVDKSLEVTSSEDESDEVKSIRLLLKKFQDLKEVWTDTGNGTEEEFRKINECILSLTDELNKIV